MQLPYKRKPRHRKELSAETIGKIATSATVDCLDHRTIAVKYRITRSLVHRVLKAHRRNCTFLVELSQREERKQEKL